jgi:drug/metabolite transporter (DMT)-like permease
MNSHLAGVLIALTASALYAVGIGMQAVEARQAPRDETLRLALLGRLIQRPLWLAGAALGVLGWVLQAVALMFAPITLVEPTLAMSLVFLLFLGARRLGEHVGLWERVGVVLVAAGLAGLGWAAPAHSPSHTTGPLLVALLGVLAAAAFAPYFIGVRGQAPPLVIAASAGIGYAFAGLSTKFATDDVHGSAWFGAGAWLAALAVVSIAAQLNENSALQLRPVTRVAPVVFSLNVLVPVALAPVLAHERWSHSTGVRIVLIASIAAVAVGMVVLAHSKTVGALIKTDDDPAPGFTSVGGSDRPPRAIPAGVPDTGE